MRIAVLGCGSIGQRHLKNLLGLGQTELVAFDPSRTIRKQTQHEIGVDCVPDLQKVWERRPQVVFVTAPTNRHIELAQQCAARGCHFFVEKPLSYSLTGIKHLCAEIERRELITMVGCNMRFHHGPATVRRLLARKKIGRLLAMRIQSGSYLPNWRPAQDYRKSYSSSARSGGAILDCIHEIDLALWYAGPAEFLSAAWIPATSIDLLTDGLAEIVLRHQNSVLANIHLNFVQRDYRRSCQMIGEQGTIYWDSEEHEIKVYGPKGTINQAIPCPKEWSLNQMYLDETAHFLRSVESGAPTFNSVADSVPALRIALKARARAHRSV